MVAIAKPRGSKNPKKSGKAKRNQDARSRSSFWKLAVPYASLAAMCLLLLGGVVTALSMAWNEAFPAEKVLDTSKMKPPDPKIESFIEEACQAATCHESLALVGRSLVATKDIDRNERLLEVPRSMQIWDLDALRDRFIRKNLYGARHPKTGNQLSSNAFLAAFIALQLHNLDGNLPNMRRMDPLRMKYLTTLPKYEDLDFHPLTWERERMDEMFVFGTFTYSYGMHHRDMLLSEYDGLATASKEFASIVNITDYTAARINVMSRAYNVGTPGPDEELAGQPWRTDELNTFRFILERNMMDNEYGCRALIPIADMLNHHPNNNAKHQYDGVNPSKGSFIVNVPRGLPRGSEPMIKYGDYAESDLLIRYGFVNGDGSSTARIKLSFHHTPLKPLFFPEYSFLRNGQADVNAEEYQRGLMRKYLLHDDGYEECIEGPHRHPEASAMKKLKSDLLVNIANDPHRWSIRIGARDEAALPPPTVDQIVDKDPPQFETREKEPETFDFGPLQSTCRIISMMESDYNGRAPAMLKENMHNPNFQAPRGNDSLEFRTYLCIGRWVGSTLMHTTQREPVQDVYKRVKELNRIGVKGPEWASAHNLLGEMQSLHMIQDIIQGIALSKYSDLEHNRPREYILRDEPCPIEYTNFLLLRPVK